jgi:uncharacterized protein YbjT (DUF2867 family)
MNCKASNFRIKNNYQIMKRVLIAGATGYLGRFAVEEFKKQGFRVRALARTPEKLESLKEYIDEPFVGEVTDKKSLSGICKDIDIVFSSIGITRQKDNLTFMDVDYQGNKNLLEEAQREGAAKFIFVSVFNAENMKNLKGIQAKLRFEEALKKSGMDYSIVYPNGFFSDMLEYMQMAKKGRGYVFGTGRNRINPIHGKDLAEVCVKAAAGIQKEIQVGGPDVFTHNNILNLAFEVLGKKSKISRIPLWVSQLFTGILRMFTSVKTYGPVEFFMTVLVADLVAPEYGSRHLREFFIENQDKN